MEQEPTTPLPGRMRSTGGFESVEQGESKFDALDMLVLDALRAKGRGTPDHRQTSISMRARIQACPRPTLASAAILRESRMKMEESTTSRSHHSTRTGVSQNAPMHETLGTVEPGKLGRLGLLALSRPAGADAPV